MSLGDGLAEEHEPTPPTGHVQEGFVLHRLTERWALLVHRPCGNTTRFVAPTRRRLDWFMKAHVCGPTGTSWSESVPSSAYGPQETSELMRYLTWLVSNTTSEVLAEQSCQSAAREAIDVLQAGLAAAGLAASCAQGTVDP